MTRRWDGPRVLTLLLAAGLGGAPVAAKAGIGPEVIEAIRDGRRPARMGEDEALIYDFTTESQDIKRVSDATFARAKARFGEAAVVDRAAISGYATFLAMEPNAARCPIPTDGTPLPLMPQ